MSAIHEAFAARSLRALGYLNLDGHNTSTAHLTVSVDFSEGVRRVALLMHEREGKRGATAALTFDDAESLRELLADAIRAGRQFHGITP